MKGLIAKYLPVGTRSVLFGAHCFFLHPWFVAAAWWKLYGFPWDPRLWVAFLVHDLGYLGQPNMDGPEGERHPYLGAAIMHILFDQWEWVFRDECINWRWFDLCLFHSRYSQLQSYMRQWVREHVNGQEDTWTSSDRHAKTQSGVWQ